MNRYLLSQEDFSRYWDFIETKLFNLFGTYFCAKIHGGTHLVAVIRKKECPSQ